MIPIGDRALAWIDRYQVEVRPGLLVGDRRGDVLFLTHRGSRSRRDQMTELVRRLRHRRRRSARRVPATCSGTRWRR